MHSRTSSENSIEVTSISKCFHIYDAPAKRLLQMLWRGKRRYYREFWALKETTFTIRRGETVGIIGRNGAGKSTLLQIIAGTLTPTSGHVRINGRLAALLELGSGFNPEFSGRENVFMNAALLGLSRQEISRRYDEIVAFSGIGDFIEQPVKHYSSGMFARLAFSVAANVDPEILIVDEALSVGDMAFQERSISKMKEIRRSGTSILFVSHSLPSVRNFCDRAIWLERGSVQMTGERLEVCDAYQAAMDEELRSELSTDRKKDKSATGDAAQGLGKTIRITAARPEKPHYRMGDDITIRIDLAFDRTPPPAYGVGVLVHDHRGTLVAVVNTIRDEIVCQEAKTPWLLTLKRIALAPGRYFATISIPDETVMFSFDKLENAFEFEILQERNRLGFSLAEGIVRLEHSWN